MCVFECVCVCESVCLCMCVCLAMFVCESVCLCIKKMSEGVSPIGLTPSDVYSTCLVRHFCVVVVLFCVYDVRIN